MIWLGTTSDPVDAVSHALQKASVGQARDGAPTHSGILGLAQREQAPLALRYVTDALKRPHTAKYAGNGLLCSFSCGLGAAKLAGLENVPANSVGHLTSWLSGSARAGRLSALGTADDAPDRSLVLRQSADSDEPNRSADRPGLSHDDRHPVACTCNCHGDTEGARARADLLLPSKQHAPGRLLHDLTVVEVAAWLMQQDLEAGWITERELMRDELSKARNLDGRLRCGPGRRPDGVLVRASGRSEAVEVE